MPQDSFEIAVPGDISPGQTLLIGPANLGMAGVTAADYLVRHLDSEKIGHITPEELPAITPFEDGKPRHHTRLYNLTNFDLTVVVGELFVPVWAARPFTEALIEWVSTNRIEEIVLLHGVPFPHGPEEHAVFYVASEPYRETRLAETDLQPLRGGFLDGVAGELISKSVDGEIPPVGVYVTPTHPPGPDIDAAFKFFDAIESVYGVEVDRAELEQRSEELKRYYSNLAERMATLEEENQRSRNREYPEDRTYM
ncbi:MAG: proteasome assembly chaperone family protein [Halobacteriota archaeon]|uniref:proteasome assembly chaperone family protein n=1 Tax=Natronomonas sp. TaxID=2184060 RepID=UPI003975C45C